MKSFRDIFKRFREEGREIKEKSFIRWLMMNYTIGVFLATLLGLIISSVIGKSYFDAPWGFRISIMLLWGAFCLGCISDKRPEPEDSFFFIMYGAALLELIFLGFREILFSTFVTAAILAVIFSMAVLLRRMYREILIREANEPMEKLEWD